MKIRKGDQILIISGKDRGKKTKVLRAFPREERILAEGVNIRKKHLRPKRGGEKGQTVEIPMPIHISNVKILCLKCGKATKINYKTIEGKKQRICKKCGQEV